MDERTDYLFSAWLQTEDWRREWRYQLVIFEHRWRQSENVVGECRETRERSENYSISQCRVCKHEFSDYIFFSFCSVYTRTDVQWEWKLYFTAEPRWENEILDEMEMD